MSNVDSIRVPDPEVLGPAIVNQALTPRSDPYEYELFVPEGYTLADQTIRIRKNGLELNSVLDFMLEGTVVTLAEILESTDELCADFLLREVV